MNDVRSSPNFEQYIENSKLDNLVFFNFCYSFIEDPAQKDFCDLVQCPQHNFLFI